MTTIYVAFYTIEMFGINLANLCCDHAFSLIDDGIDPSRRLRIVPVAVSCCPRCDL